MLYLLLLLMLLLLLRYVWQMQMGDELGDEGEEGTAGL
jgi:hypothetical protein